MSCSTNYQNCISTIDVSHIISEKVLKMMAKKAHKMIEEKLEDIEELEWGKRCIANFDALNEAKDRADYIVAFVFAIYQQLYVVKNTLVESNLDVFASVWVPGRNIVEIVEQQQLKATSPVWLPNGMEQPKMRRFRANGAVIV